MSTFLFVTLSLQIFLAQRCSSPSLDSVKDISDQAGDMNVPFEQPLPEGEFLIHDQYSGAQHFCGIGDPSAVKVPRFAWTASDH